jgi:hypothetical protein
MLGISRAILSIKMQQISNHNDHSTSYRERLAVAIAEAKNLGFTRPSRISEKTTIQDKALSLTNELISDLSSNLSMLVPGYWGNSCQTLSTHIFAALNNNGVPAEIVLGTVFVDECDIFETTLDDLQKEVRAMNPLTGDQAVHAWVTLGDDTIIDAALFPRLVKNHDAPTHLQDRIIIGRAAEMVFRHNLRYEPLLVGSEFFAKTNPPDPMDFVNSR